MSYPGSSTLESRLGESDMPVPVLLQWPSLKPEGCDSTARNQVCFTFISRDVASGGKLGAREDGSGIRRFPGG